MCRLIAKVVLSLHIICVLIVSTSVRADFFSRGNTSVSVIVGSGQAFNESYTIVGGGLNYYVLNGLSLGLEAEFWLGGDPSIFKLSPQLQYVFTSHSDTRPYIGAFFRKAKIDGLQDLDSIGYRVGVYLSSGSDYNLGAGLVFEDYQDCNEAVFISCSTSFLT